MTSKTKICSSCSQKLPLSSFSRKKDNKDGLQYSCRSCYNQKQIQYNRVNLDKVHKSVRNYYVNNKEKILKKARDTYHQKKNKGDL